MELTDTHPPYEQRWPAVAGSVPTARHAVLGHLRAVATPDPPLSDIALALSEAVSNVVVHAYQSDDDTGEFRIAVRLHSEEIELVVEDDGGGMVPRPDSPGLGLGLPLIATLSSRFDAQTLPDGGTRLSIWFSRHPGDKLLPA